MLTKKQLVFKIVLKRLWYLLFGIMVIAIAIQLYLLRGTPSRPLDMQHLHSDVSYTSTPTLLIPGQGGNTITFDTVYQTGTESKYRAKCHGRARFANWSGTG